MLAAPPAEAATYYFSNCVTGGAGTQANPYCIDPAGNGNKTSFKYLMDGAAPDVGPGDTIYLCAGACDGTGTGTYNLGVAGTATSNNWTYVFSPVVSGTASAPITISGYPGETVILSGDTNNNGIPEAGEPDTMITDVTNAGSNRQWYVWKNFIVEKLQEAVFYINNNPANWTFDNIEVRYFDAQMWNGGTVAAAGCNDQGGGYVFKVADLQGPLTIKNSRFHHICGFVHRVTVNPSSGSILVENNEYYNVTIVDNEFQSRNITWRGNYLHDFMDGISMEDDMQNVVIEDNIVACPGDWKVESDGRCRTGITINDGNNGPASAGKTKNVTIRRNRIYGSVDGQYGNTLLTGYFYCALNITATNNTESINTLIENNFIWHHLSWASEPECAAGIGIRTNRSEVTIQNNTLYDTANGIYLDGTVGGMAYTVRNNLVVKAGKGSTNNPELTIASNAAGSSVLNNNLNSGGQGDPVMRVSGTNYSCAQVPGYQSGNKCQATTFVRSSGTPVKDWDLHLPTTDTANRNAGTTGPADDIDKQPRGAPPIDIGADEIGGTGVTATLAVNSGGQPAPSLNGVYLLKAGTYALTLTASAPVVSVPTPLTFTDSAGGTTIVTLAGTVPGTVFTASLTVGTNIAEGNGAFTLPALSLVDGSGNKGQTITAGSSAVIDRSPPAAPTGVRTQ